ncbi:unnamed protein product [Rotaria magnacalcarata]|uniref:Uncharacterized protein n=1 Tax=Rotaria magnacalcarata TaxID=392030 RepID=A0A820PQY0_9BILA|nr:unnamed protein product [Rotaria magnacalcarata]
METISSSLAFIVKRLSGNVNLVIVPPVALISVPNGTTIHCPGFNLPGSIILDAKANILNIIKNLSQIEENNESIDIHKEFNSNVTWGKLPYVSGSVDALI